MASAPLLAYYTTGKRVLETTVNVQGAMRKTELAEWIAAAEQSMGWMTDVTPFYAFEYRRRWHIFERTVPTPKVVTRSRSAVEMWLIHRSAAHG